jgi:cytochrome c-type biogenesis protein CcmH/NrfG
LVDGSILSAPYDPGATKSSDRARGTNPPTTEVFNPGTSLDSLPQTQAAPKDLQSTIHAPFVPQQVHQRQSADPRVPEYFQSRTDYAPRKTSVLKKLLIALAVLMVLLVGVFIFLEIMFATHRSTIQNNMMPNANASPDLRKQREADDAAVANLQARVREELRADPDNADLNRQLAATLLHQEKYAEAEALARKAVRLKPNFAAAHYTLAAVLKKQDRNAESDAEQKLADKLAARGQ